MVTTKIKEITKTKKKVTIEVPAEKVSGFLKKAYQKVGSQAKLKGFRPGKVPHKVLDQYYHSDIDVECLNHMVDETFPEALKSHDLYPLTRPHFDIKPLTRDAAYEYSVEVEVKPDFKLKEYKGLKLTKHDTEASEKEITHEIEAIRENVAPLKPAENAKELKTGLIAVIDFTGTIDGKKFEGGTAKDYNLAFGKGTFLKGFEEQMQGMKVGDERVLKITFPQDYFKKDIAGKEAQFQVSLKSLNEKDLPPIDDELAKDVGKKDLQELKAEIAKMIATSKKNHARGHSIDEIRKIILKEYAKLEVPQTLVEEEAKKSKRKTEEVAEQFRFEFVLEAIAKEEKLQASPEDVDARLKFYAQIYRKPLDEIKKLFLNQQMLPHLVTGILIDKALDIIIESAKF